MSDDGVLAQSIFAVPIGGPSGSTNVQITSDDPLSISSTSTTMRVISSGKTFTLQQIVAGAEGDPNGRGSRIEVFYRTAASVEKLVARVYLSGLSQVTNFSNVNTARDGTVMVGNTTEAILLRRTRLSGGNGEIDALLRGFEI